MPKHNYKSLLNANLDKTFIKRTINPKGLRHTVGGKPASVVTEQRDGIVYPTLQKVKGSRGTRLRHFTSNQAMDRAIKNNNFVKVPKGMDFGRWLSQSSYVNKLRNK